MQHHSQQSVQFQPASPLGLQDTLTEIKQARWDSKWGIFPPLVHQQNTGTAGDMMGTVLFPAGKPGPLQVPPKSHWGLDTRNQGIDKWFLGALGRGGKGGNSCWLSLKSLRWKEALFYHVHLTNKQLNDRGQGWTSPAGGGCIIWIPLHLPEFKPSKDLFVGLLQENNTHSEFWGSRTDEPRDLMLSPNCAATKTSSFSLSRVRAPPKIILQFSSTSSQPP